MKGIAWGGVALTALVTSSLGGSGPTPAAAVQAAGDVDRVLVAVRGASADLCDLVQSALGNRWGNRSGGATLNMPWRSGSDGALEVGNWHLDQEHGPTLVRSLEASDACERRTAARLLGMLGRLAPWEPVRRVAERGDGGPRVAAVLALGYRGDPDDTDLLAGLSASPDPELRLTAVWALGRGEAPEALSPLIRALGHADVATRENAAWSMGRVGDADRDAGRRAIAPLSRSLRDPQPSVRVNAAWALGAIENPEAIPALVAVLGADSDPEVRRAAAAALARIE